MYIVVPTMLKPYTLPQLGTHLHDDELAFPVHAHVYTLCTDSTSIPARDTAELVSLLLRCSAMALACAIGIGH